MSEPAPGHKYRAGDGEGWVAMGLQPTQHLRQRWRERASPHVTVGLSTAVRQAARDPGIAHHPFFTRGDTPTAAVRVYGDSDTAVVFVEAGVSGRNPLVTCYRVRSVRPEYADDPEVVDCAALRRYLWTLASRGGEA